MILCCASTTSAHPDYEHLERVVTDGSGRQLHLVKWYWDGLVFTDPVTLLVRGADGKTLAKTPPGRDVSVVCWPTARCLAFRYEGFLPVVPEDVWVLREGRLDRVDSIWAIGLRALGIVVPLWTNWLGYLVATALAFPPFVLLPLVARWRGVVRDIIVVLLCIAGPLYLIPWTYVVVALSDLSLPLELLVIATVMAICRALRRRFTADQDGRPTGVQPVSSSSV
jgi:hypothetical protein